MRISKKKWNKHTRKLLSISQKATEKMQEFIDKHGIDDMDAIFLYAKALTDKYGEAAASVTCDMYEAIAIAQKANIQAAVPARNPTLQEIKDVIMHAAEKAPSTVSNEVGKLVKKTSTRTMRKNAARDGAKMALVPSGDGCVFCKMLGSRGWENARSSKSFEAHLHANCRCEYVVRFNGNLTVEGYDPEALYEEFMQYDGSWTDKMNAMRVDQHSEDKDRINAQKRAAYKRQVLAKTEKTDIINTSGNLIDLNLQFFAEKLSNASNDSLINGIVSKKEAIEKHRRYIKDPTIKCSDYYDRDPRYQKGLIEFWEKEIREMEASIQRRIEELKKRGIDYYGE